MATRKQRRRRAKEKRHDYEVVYLDSEGNEVEPDEIEAPKVGKSPARAASKSTGSSGKSSRLVREPKPPSWQRAARRGAIFMPILIGVVILTNRKNTSPLGIVVIAIVFTALVIPFGYFTDHLAFKAYQKRLASKPSGKSPRR